MPIPKTEMQWAQFMVGRCFEVLAQPVPFTVVSYDPKQHTVSLHIRTGRLTGFPIHKLIQGLKEGTIEESAYTAPFTVDCPATRYVETDATGRTPASTSGTRAR
jgi:hypothetical protein